MVSLMNANGEAYFGGMSMNNGSAFGNVMQPLAFTRTLGEKKGLRDARR